MTAGLRLMAGVRTTENGWRLRPKDVAGVTLRG